MKNALLKVVSNTDEESVDRFIRFLEKDRQGKINYMEFLSKMSEVSNREHNPFKSVVNRLKFFLETNKLTPHQLLKRLQAASSTPDQGVSIEQFAHFLKMKIDKKRTMSASSQ